MHCLCVTFLTVFFCTFSYGHTLNCSCSGRNSTPLPHRHSGTKVSALDMVWTLSGLLSGMVATITGYRVKKEIKKRRALKNDNLLLRGDIEPEVDKNPKKAGKLPRFVSLSYRFSTNDDKCPLPSASWPVVDAAQSTSCTRTEPLVGTMDSTRSSLTTVPRLSKSENNVKDLAQHSSKYAKWKATYIHNCLKNGIMPQPGPLGADEFGEGQDACPAFPNFDPYSGGAGLTGGDAMGGAGASSSNQHPFAPDPGQSSAFAPQPPPIPQPTYQPAYVPPTTPMQNLNISAPGGGPAAALTPQQTVKAQKYCKYASSALEYDDVPEAIANLRKALILLETGVDS